MINMIQIFFQSWEPIFSAVVFFFPPSGAEGGWVGGKEVLSLFLWPAAAVEE